MASKLGFLATSQDLDAPVSHRHMTAETVLTRLEYLGCRGLESEGGNNQIFKGYKASYLFHPSYFRCLNRGLFANENLLEYQTNQFLGM